MFSSVNDAESAVQSRAIMLALNIPNDFSYGILSGINSHEEIINGIPLVDNPEIQNRYLAYQVDEIQRCALEVMKNLMGHANIGQVG